MKRSLLRIFGLIFGLLFVTALVWGQQSEPGNSRKRVYVDPQTHAIYWPKSLPFYLRLATGPDKNDASFLLDNVFSGGNSGKGDSLKGGVRLDVSGRQFIRWHNYLTGDSILFVFYSDGDAPAVSLQLEGASSHKSGEQVVYGAGLKASLTARDSLSGVEDIFVSIDDGNFESYKAPYSFTQERPYRIRAYAVDRVGNASAIVSREFVVDLTPPKTDCRVLAHAIGNVLSPKAEIELKASDRPAGVQHIYFKFDSTQGFSVYSGKPISVANLPTGSHTLTYYSLDQVGNKEDTTVFRFYLDKKAPKINTFVLGDQFMQKTTVCVSPRSKIKFQAEDNKIGVQTVEYALKKGDYQPYTKPFTLSPEKKIYAITYKVKDKLGNVSGVGHLLFRMDAVSPESQLRFDGPNFEQRGRFWISSATKIVLSAKDSDSGVQGIKYQIGDDPEIPYEKPFVFEKEGKYALHFFALDRVNNAERPHTIAVVVDNTPPRLVVNFSAAPIAGADSDSGAVVYPLDTSLFLGSTDASSGAAGIWYTLNGAKEKQYRSPLTFGKSGLYEVRVRTEDRVHNEAVKKLKFKIAD